LDLSHAREILFVVHIGLDTISIGGEHGKGCLAVGAWVGVVQLLVGNGRHMVMMRAVDSILFLEVYGFS